MKLSIYQAGPITGCSYEECTGWRDYLQTEFPEVTWLSPMRGKSHLEDCQKIKASYNGSNGLKQLLSGDRGILARDSWDVLRCDILFANFEGYQEFSIGTVMEIAWAWLLRKPTIVVGGYDHPMLNEATDFRCKTFEEGITVLRSLL